MSGGELRRILVTGANKGIGLAIVERILGEYPNTFVYLGSRDEARGHAARTLLVEAHADWDERVQVVPLDVSRDDSVSQAASVVDGPLFGLVNNAGVGGDQVGLQTTLQVNSYGPRRVCETFRGHLDTGARVVIVTSAAGPSFVSKCNDEMQALFMDDSLSWEKLDRFMKECLTLADAQAFVARGLADGNAYGLSKACANAYMRIFSRSQPHLLVSACTPGFIATDLTKQYAVSQGKSPEEMGMKTPHEGATAPLHCLFGKLEASGWYYGSDAQRSPLHRYRSPGDPPYTGER